jgi:hypothetical protein
VADGKLLGIYLNDHLAGATMGIELARRSLRANRGTEFGRFLEELVGEIEEDKRTLETVMEALDVPKSAVKPRLAVVVERLGRMKLNGQVTGYSPLSRVLELEGLTIGVAGKLSLWRNLRDGAGLAGRLPGVDLDALIARAERQLSSIAEHRIAAARLALTAPGD